MEDNPHTSKSFSGSFFAGPVRNVESETEKHCKCLEQNKETT